MTKSRMIRWADYVARIRVKKVAHVISVRNLKESNQLEDIGVDSMTILKYILKK
jgi:hypothetical protein